MDDKLLSSLCGDPTSYCTFKTQKDARNQCKSPPNQISHDGDTYIHMVVCTDTHWVAVQVTISPFTLERYPNQIFFSSQLRCGPCCTHIYNTDTVRCVTDTVQKVINTNYQPVYWNYCANQCTVDLPSNTDIRQCTSVTKSTFQAYAALSGAIPTSPDKSLPTTTASQTAGLSPPVTSRIIPTENYPPGCQPDTPNLLSPRATTTAHTTEGSVTSGTEYSVSKPSNATPKRKRGISEQNEALGPSRVLAKGSRGTKADQDAELVRRTLATLEDGLAKVPASNTIASLKFELVPGMNAHSIGSYIWDYAASLEKVSKTLLWTLKHIACCCWLVGAKFVSSPETMPETSVRDRTTIHHWRCGAEAINLIVNGMLETWGEIAYAIFNVFADKGLNMADVGRLSVPRRRAVIEGIINGLQKLEPPCPGETSLFQPTNTLMRLCSYSEEEVNGAINLSNARRISVERSPVRLREVLDIGSLVNKFMATPISRDKELTVRMSTASVAPITSMETVDIDLRSDSSFSSPAAEDWVESDLQAPTSTQQGSTVPSRVAELSASATSPFDALINLAVAAQWDQAHQISQAATPQNELEGSADVEGTVLPVTRTRSTSTITHLLSGDRSTQDAVFEGAEAESRGWSPAPHTGYSETCMDNELADSHPGYSDQAIAENNLNGRTVNDDEWATFSHQPSENDPPINLEEYFHIQGYLVPTTPPARPDQETMISTVN